MDGIYEARARCQSREAIPLGLCPRSTRTSGQPEGSSGLCILWIQSADYLAAQHIRYKRFFPPPQPAREPWLLHASGLAAQKRFPDIIRAFARVRAARPGAELHVAGNGSTSAEIVAMAKRELPPTSVRFYGLLSKPELAGLMR